mgnify:CR=1 FL=1
MIEFIEIMILVVMVISPATILDQERKGNLVAPTPACEVEYAKSSNGNYYYVKSVRDTGLCTVT